MKVTIENFQPFSSIEIDVEGLTVLVGPSNVGKSAFIRALSSALFGRAGDYFVRIGQKFSKVEINGTPGILPTNPTLDIEWYKGQGINKFKIDGALHDKVGVDVPLLIQSSGYRDIPVGDEYIRPQVSEQFDRMFLLDRSGSFVHDVIAQASRLSVLLKADRACSSDLKRQKQLQKIRTGDLVMAESQLEETKPWIEFHSRVQVLREKFIQIRRLNDRIQILRQMYESRTSLKEIASQKLPLQKPIPADIGQRELEASRLIQARAILSTMPVMPEVRKADLRGVERLMQYAPELKSLSDEKKRVARQLDDQLRAALSLKQEGEVISAELKMALASIKVCPTCLRPMETVSSSS